MNSLIIKLGKVKATLKQNGIKNGIKKIYQDSKLFIKGEINYRKSGQVLLISGGVGDSARYRTFNVAEDLNLRGIEALAVNQSNFRLIKLIKNFSVIVFHHRIILDEHLKKAIQLAQKLNKKIIFDTDDLVLTKEQWEKTEYYQQANEWEKKQYQKKAEEYFLQKIKPSVVTVSTSYLKNFIKESYHYPVYKVTNKINQLEVKQTEKILERKTVFRQTNSILKLGYFSGTLSHNRDFATIIPALEKILTNYPKVNLFLVGPLNVQNKFIQKFQSQIKRLPFVPRLQHFQNLSQIDINLIPLQIGDPFCESKSEIKFAEAGTVKVPSVATATQTFREIIQDGKNGFLAYDSKDWEDKLIQLIENDKLREKIGEEARKTVLDNYITGRGNLNVQEIYD